MSFCGIIYVNIASRSEGYKYADAVIVGDMDNTLAQWLSEADMIREEQIRELIKKYLLVADAGIDCR